MINNNYTDTEVLLERDIITKEEKLISLLELFYLLPIF